MLDTPCIYNTGHLPRISYITESNQLVESTRVSSFQLNTIVSKNFNSIELEDLLQAAVYKIYKKCPSYKPIKILQIRNMKRPDFKIEQKQVIFHLKGNLDRSRIILPDLSTLCYGHTDSNVCF